MDEKIGRIAIDSYIEQLRNGDPHAVTTAHMLRATLTQLGLTPENVGTTDEEIEKCILDGRQVAAAMLLMRAEREVLTDEVIIHFFTSTLRYGTKSYKEVVAFLRDTAERCTTPLVKFEAGQPRFEEAIQGCYATVAKYLLSAAIQNRELPLLLILDEVIAEGELEPERHLGVTRNEIEKLKRRIHNFHEDCARKALLCLQEKCDHEHIPESMNSERATILIAMQDGGVTLQDMEISRADMEKITAAHTHEALLRSKAAFN